MDLLAVCPCYLIVLSGRALSDIKKRTGIRKIYYGGNHGLDISGPNLRYTHPKALTAKPAIEYVTRKLRKEIANIEGAWLEKKCFSLSLHFRSVKTEDIRLIKKVFHNVVEDYSKNNLFTIMKGKKVLEVLPEVSWDKGKADRAVADIKTTTTDLGKEAMRVFERAIELQSQRNWAGYSLICVMLLSSWG